jgi:predicted glycosyltransferase
MNKNKNKRETVRENIQKTLEDMAGSDSHLKRLLFDILDIELQNLSEQQKNTAIRQIANNYSKKD